MPVSIPIDTATQADQSPDLDDLQRIQSEFAGFSTSDGFLIIAGAADTASVHESDWREEVERIAPSNAQLRASVIRFPAPQEWLDEEEQPF